MNDTQNIQNPTTWSDYDFLEFECFVSKVRIEGYAYAAEHYSPRFEDPQLQDLATDDTQLRTLYEENHPKVDNWYETVGSNRACDLHNDHVDEERQRREDACLFGIRCADGYVIPVETRAGRDCWVERLRGGEGKGWRVPETLLVRWEPGGEWIDEATAA